MNVALLHCWSWRRVTYMATRLLLTERMISFPRSFRADDVGDFRRQLSNPSASIALDPTADLVIFVGGKVVCVADHNLAESVRHFWGSNMFAECQNVKKCVKRVCH